MKKMLLIFLLLFAGCTKDYNTQELLQKSTPTYIQIEAVHEDGSTKTSEIVLVR